MISSAYSYPWFTSIKRIIKRWTVRSKKDRNKAWALAAKCKITESKESQAQAGKCTDKQIKGARL